MTAPRQLCIQVTDASQVGEARRATVSMAKTLPLSESRCADAAIVATELATNLWRHARDGRLLLQAHLQDGAGWLELLSVDAGPGMADVQRCFRDGFSTGGTPGNGLGAVRRLADVFDVYSSPGQGTVLLARVSAGQASANGYTLGAVCLPATGEVVSGDSWRAAERDGRMAVMVADGLGHGPEAAEASSRAGRVFESQPFTTPAQFYRDAHRSLIGSRGAAVSRAVIDPAGAVQFAGVGNVAGSLVGGERGRGMASQNGTVGVEMRSQVTAFDYTLPDPGVLLLHSDGITSRWSFDAYPGLVLRHPAVIAGVLSRDFVRGRDDATVVVIGRTRRNGANG